MHEIDLRLLKMLLVHALVFIPLSLSVVPLFCVLSWNYFRLLENERKTLSSKDVFAAIKWLNFHIL